MLRFWRSVWMSTSPFYDDKETVAYAVVDSYDALLKAANPNGC